MAGLWLLCLAAADAIARSGGDVRRLSVATALRRVRKATAAPTTRCGSAGLGRQLANALKDNYARTTSKRSRDWAHKKKPKPIGDPKARIADEQEIQLALELRRLAPAANYAAMSLTPSSVAKVSSASVALRALGLPGGRSRFLCGQCRAFLGRDR